MTQAQAEDLIKRWAEYQLGSHDTRVGPKDFSAPMLRASGPPCQFFGEYQFVQREIETAYHKAWDRTMAVAILQSWFWHGKALQTQLMDTRAQETAIRSFVERMKVMSWNPPMEKMEVVA
jgi:hypothetical protein